MRNLSFFWVSGGVTVIAFVVVVVGLAVVKVNEVLLVVVVVGGGVRVIGVGVVAVAFAPPMIASRLFKYAGSSEFILNNRSGMALNIHNYTFRI